MTIAVEKAAESYQDISKDIDLDVNEVREDSIKLLKDTYVDDSIIGGSKKQVKRMIGIK